MNYPKIEESWLSVLSNEFSSPYMEHLKTFLQERLARGAIIHPIPSSFFAAMNRTPLPNVRVVIIGQDPYHGPGQAHGLSFSVPRGIPHPPSLRNILKELSIDSGIPVPKNGCLEAWADRGVLLLNSVLSVEEGQAASHANKGWEQFTDAIVRAVDNRPGHIAFILWGAYAQRKASFVDQSRHLIVKCVHPSPLSAHRGFFGSRPFSKVNTFLEKSGINGIDWRIE
jgi:uracil-DNA glycosylase